MLLRMSDDSGFLALADPDSYEGFVAEDWEFPQLVEHLLGQVKKGRLVVWATGGENEWEVEVHTEPVPVSAAFREFQSPIAVSNSRLFLLNYEVLSMAAQYAGQTLVRQAALCESLTLPNGSYQCRVVQRVDPTGDLAAQRPHFIIQLTPTSETAVGEMAAIPWT